MLKELFQLIILLEWLLILIYTVMFLFMLKTKKGRNFIRSRAMQQSESGREKSRENLSKMLDKVSTIKVRMLVSSLIAITAIAALWLMVSKNYITIRIGSDVLLLCIAGIIPIPIVVVFIE